MHLVTCNERVTRDGYRPPSAEHTICLRTVVDFLHLQSHTGLLQNNCNVYGDMSGTAGSRHADIYRSNWYFMYCGRTCVSFWYHHMAETTYVNVGVFYMDYMDM